MKRRSQYLVLLYQKRVPAYKEFESRANSVNCRLDLGRIPSAPAISILRSCPSDRRRNV